MQRLLLQETPNLTILEGSVEDLLLDEGDGIESLAPFVASSQKSFSPEAIRASQQASSTTTIQNRKARIRGVLLADSTEITSRAVVITTGTFLRGVLMIGKDRYAGGRHLRDSEKVGTYTAHFFTTPIRPKLDYCSYYFLFFLNDYK